jgi:hypothetical protein
MRSFLKWAVICSLSLAALVFIVNQTPDRSTDTQKATVERSSVTETPFHPNAVATSFMAAPGAIVCQDFASLRLVFDLYSHHWEDTMQDKLTNGQSQVLRGPPSPTPDLKVHGCSLVRPGTPVYVENSDAFTTGIPKVSTKLPDGTMVRGVTLPKMLSKQH